MHRCGGASWKLRLLQHVLVAALSTKVSTGGEACVAKDVTQQFKESWGESRVVVLFPDLHRSGGPAHFHQLHSGLNRIGFSSLMHHVNPYYQDEYTRNLTTMFTSDNISSRDVLILPCDWSMYLSRSEEAALRATGVRAVVVVTGVAFPQEDGLLDLSDFSQGRAIPFAHSHYSHTFYQLPWDSEKHILWAPVEPWVIDAHRTYEKMKASRGPGATLTAKENLILLDPDAKHEVVLPQVEDISVEILFEKTREELIELFKRAKVLYDIYLNGHEHLPREAVLFDVVPILTTADNGGDMVDFPMPNEFRVDELCAECSANVLRKVLGEFEEHRLALEPLKRAVLDRPTLLLNTLEATFSTRVYQFHISASTYAEEGHALIAAVRLLTTMPLASVQISVRKGGKSRLIRRAGGLVRRFVELGLTDKEGGQKYHSLRFVENPAPTVVHGDLLVVMNKPYYVYNFSSLVAMAKKVLAAEHCHHYVFFQGDLVFSRLPKLVKGHTNGATICNSTTEERAALPLPGAISMEVFSVALTDARQMLAAKSDVDSEKQMLGWTGVAQTVCTSLCTLAANPTWQSTGIFRRIFDPRIRTDNTSIVVRVDDNVLLRHHFPCSSDSDQVVGVIMQKFDLAHKDLYRTLLNAVQGRKKEAPCFSEAYNHMCGTECLLSSQTK